MGPSNGYRVLLLVGVALAGAAVDSAAAQQDKPDGPGPSFFTLKNFNPSMAIVMIVLITAFFLLGFFSIYLRRCVGPPLGGTDEYASQGPGVGGGLALTTARRAQRGLDRAVLDLFPTMAYADVKAHKAGGKIGALECAVCLSEFDDDEMLRLLSRCAHAFHADCIDAWLASHVTCPVCRAVLVHDAEAPASAGAVSATEQGDVPASTQQPAPQTATVRAPPEQAQPEQVAVVVVPAEETEQERIRREEAAELMRIGSVKRALRSKSGRRPAQFPRSHTTGHSLAAAAPDSAERYTLRLPEHVLQEVVAASRLRRSASVQSFWTRRGFGGAQSGRSVRLGQSGRWPNMSLLARSLSARLPAWGSPPGGRV